MLFVGLVPNAWADVFVQNDQKYVDDYGSLHIVGEIQNNLNVPLNQIEVLVTLYSSGGQKVGTASTAPLLHTIMPGMKGPFDLVIREDQSKVATYSLDVAYKVTTPKNQVIEITSSDYKLDILDNFVITGTVANRGEITANTVVVVATLYDKYGNVLAASKTHAEPDYLRANDEMFFFVAIPDNEHSGKAVDFTLVAESEEYTAVPEFSLGSILLLGVSVSAYVLFTRYSGRLIANVVSATNSR